MASARITRHYNGTDGAIQFATPALRDAFETVVHGWPATDGAGPEGVFATVAQSVTGGWQINGLRPEPFERAFTEVSGICDLIVELNWSRLRQQGALMCLHAAAVEMADGRLVIFPSGRRAGKSTLTAELARRGHRVFSDDILPVTLTAQGMITGLATGVAPRLRLPLPRGAPWDFADWVAADCGPADRQYKYLLSAPVAVYDAPARIAAIVTLNRGGTPGAPSFAPMGPGEMLPILIHQNFGRFVHSGRALAVFDALVRGVPCVQLNYDDLGAAADLIEAMASEGLLSGGARADDAQDGVARLDEAGGATFVPHLAYGQRPGLTVTEIGGAAYVADASGIGIFELNAGLLPIWRLLEEPMCAVEVTAILSEVYGAGAPPTLAQDVTHAMAHLTAAELIAPVSERGG
ncbi:hypothetical protein [Gymnodinialimonas ulvae]|uniref:hypothetical protein n=1 Tax=Gymnodinialimonas ulvae TaxID=3126504 RepID=UPI00309E1F22